MKEGFPMRCPPVVLLNRITHYIVNRKGKQMRPMFVFLTAKLLGKTNERTYRAASVPSLSTQRHWFTMMWSMTAMRRGFFSINASEK